MGETPTSATHATVEGRKLKAGITLRPSRSGGRYRQLDGGLWERGGKVLDGWRTAAEGRPARGAE